MPDYKIQRLFEAHDEEENNKVTLSDVKTIFQVSFEVYLYMLKELDESHDEQMPNNIALEIIKKHFPTESAVT